MLSLWAGLLVCALPQQVVPTSSTASPQIELISIDYGGGMHATFGHTALRVKYPSGKDLSYNFGGVDMDQSNFWVLLMQGQVEAFLDVQPYHKLLLHYSGEDRTIKSRALALSPGQATHLAQRLKTIAASEKSRRYVYNHIYDNCTTRVAELLDEVLDGQLSVVAKSKSVGTQRQWIMRRARHSLPIYLALDLTGNGSGDKPISLWQTTFLPDAFDQIVDSTQIKGAPLVSSIKTEYQSINYLHSVLFDWPWTRIYLLLGLPLLLLSWYWTRLGTLIFGLSSGLTGCFILGLWLSSNYAFFGSNWNLVVFLPTQLILGLSALKSSWWQGSASLRKLYLLSTSILLGALALLQWVGVVEQSIGPMLALALPLTWLQLYQSVKPSSANYRVGRNTFQHRRRPDSLIARRG